MLVLLFATFVCTALAAADKVYIKGTSIDGVQRELDVSRYPSLYTRDFDDCLDGQSLFNITKFDAAYYADNSTVLFHLDGTTNVRNEDLVRMSAHLRSALLKLSQRGRAFSRDSQLLTMSSAHRSRGLWSKQI